MNENKNKGGRPILPSGQKKKNRITIYLSDQDLENLDRLRIGIVKYSSNLSLNDFFRMVVNNFDDTLIPYLQEHSTLNHNVFDEMKLNSKNMISYDELMIYLEVTENYLGKLFNSCSLMKRRFYTIKHLEFLADNLKAGNYRRVLLVNKLKEFIEEKKGKII